MTNISLKSIKHESIRNIFLTIASADQISRAEIAKRTDLSLVTVGKIVDALLELDVISQEKEIRSQAGRRAGILRMNDKRYALIYDLTSENFGLSVIDLRLRRVARETWANDPSVSFEENLVSFLSDSAPRLLKEYGEENCFGVGFSVSSPYQKETDTMLSNRCPELRQIRLMDLAKRYFTSMPVGIESQVDAAARSNIEQVEDSAHKNVIYWYVGSNLVCGAFLFNGKLILGKDYHACDFGRMLYSRGVTLEERVALCTSKEECAEALCGTIHNVQKMLSAHAMLLEFNLPYDCAGIDALLTEKLLNEYSMLPVELPEFVYASCRFRHAHRGLTMALRERWLNLISYGTEEYD